MAMEFRLPDIGEGVAEGEIVQWLVNVGDTIAEDQALVEVMTDKVTAEIPSPYNGVVKELRGNPGDVINVGTVIVVLDEPGSSSAPTSKKDAPKAETPKPASKKPSTAPAPSGGNGKHHANPPAAATGGKVLAAPATRKLAREQGVDIAALSGTGPRGRITPDDVRQAAESTGGGTAVASPPATQTPKQPAIKTTPKPCPLADKTGEERIPFTGMRRKIGEH
nr:E3 binding domain-containing protein [Vampirovibrio sp.]